MWQVPYGFTKVGPLLLEGIGLHLHHSYWILQPIQKMLMQQPLATNPTYHINHPFTFQFSIFTRRKVQVAFSPT